jgi:Predicted transcriptional regulator containing an HTH domain and an uncharacterized domain shared with the mammalian protein Schlafen
MTENYNSEFKREFTEDIKKTVVAFLNSDGGTVYIGLEDDGTAKGIADPDLVMQRLSLSIRNSIRPDCSQFINIRGEKYEEKDIVRLNVVRGLRKPYYLGEKGMRPSGVYVRIGTTSVPADEEQIRTMLKETDKESFESAVSIRQDLTFDTAQKYFSDKEIGFADNQKRTLGLIDEDGFFTNLALLLSDQCSHSIKCAIFQGKTKEIFKDRKEFSGSLFKQIDEVLSYLNVYNKTYTVISSKERIEKRDYPEQAIREAVLNAVVHRDYSYEGSILINIYEDRMEILSLGGLVKGLDEDLIKAGISECRNKKLADIFYRFKYIEAYGTGIPRIFEVYNTAGRIPHLDLFSAAFRIELPNLSEKKAKETVSTMQTYEEMATGYLKDNASMAKEDAAALFGVAPPRAYVILEALSAKGTLKIEKVGRAKRYLLP